MRKSIKKQVFLKKYKIMLLNSEKVCYNQYIIFKKGSVHYGKDRFFKSGLFKFAIRTDKEAYCTVRRKVIPGVWR